MLSECNNFTEVLLSDQFDLFACYASNFFYVLPSKLCDYNFIDPPV